MFGLPATWVPLEFRHQAEVTGATVVDRASVITTHLAEVVRRNAGRLLGRQDVKMLIDLVKQTDPVVIDELNGANITAGEIQRVLQSLLDEGVGIRDLVRIFEVVSERARVTKDPEQIVEAVRTALGPAISASYARDGKLPVLTLDPLIEHSLAEALRTGDTRHATSRSTRRSPNSSRLAVARDARRGRDEGHRAGVRVRRPSCAPRCAGCCTRPRPAFPFSPTRSSARSSSSTRSGW